MGCSFYHLYNLRSDIWLLGPVYSFEKALDRYIQETKKSIGISAYPEDKYHQWEQSQHLSHPDIAVPMAEEGRISIDKKDILIEPEHVSGTDNNAGGCQ